MRHTVVLTAALLTMNALADECPGGGTSTEGCRKLLVPLERLLASTESAVETRLRERLEKGNGPEYATDAVTAFRASNRVWRQLRDRECWYEALRDGMSTSPDYASPVAEACKVARTRERIKWVAR
ncbi:lysozyme inhibitor LprI family protein [Roseateles sp. P5_E8]